ncbi:sigma-70 family RNA polymerase sigma factor [Nonomuraea turkmeniaca]|uniref:Sigma-70 family RNA polymerase sigma factor n=1 Tax=Nonomuraea turkmeniaca TaxID=103838 RepID=A0A5S4EV35_9ACTN|nr:sigma-70 family RNA polymerase sigma factor [Nonomuraea turkmeniaca]TMR06589.1 sigma-70 family RNA polymerase sigma factor [Nonomuraea turkmeniaca]
MVPARIEDLLRAHAPQVLGALVRRYGHFDTAEDAVQEALLAASTQWPACGIPQEPRTWLIRVASRRLIDILRSEQSRREREAAEAVRIPPEQYLAPPADAGLPGDDSLALLFVCCHPALSRPSQVALTLRAVGGLTTAEIAHAFLVPEPTLAQRISRAKKQIKTSGIGFQPPPPDEYAARLDAVLQVLYLIFNEGYVATAGPELQRADLAAEAIRLTRMLHRVLPDDGEVAGLLALMLLVHSRRAARTDAGGALVPLAEQDRGLWDRDEIDEGVALVTHAMSHADLGPYQLQAAIAAVHAEAATAGDTDWRQILGLYDLLERMTDNPVVTLNRAVAVAMVHGPRAGLTFLTYLDDDPRLAGQHRLEAVRGHLLELAGEPGQARECYETAARRTTSRPEQRYLQLKAAQLAGS